MVEIIVTIVIMGILSLGTLVSIKHLYTRAAKTDAISTFSINSEVVLNQISSLLYDRVPSTVIGYNTSNQNFKTIYDIDSNFTVLEWIGVAKEAMDAREYSGFVDMDKSDKNNKIIATYDLNVSELNTTEYKKFGISYTYSSPKDANVTALIFAGSFDSGADSLDDFNNSFGWHGNEHKLIYDITNAQDNNITLSVKPKEIYEKFYLIDSAYAVARGADINISTCKGYTKTAIDTNDTLYLFYNYRPWKKETFCADPNGSNQDGNVTVLAKNVVGFRAGLINDSIYFDLTFSKKIRGSDNNVTISKQKVVF